MRLKKLRSLSALLFLIFSLAGEFDSLAQTASFANLTGGLSGNPLTVGTSAVLFGFSATVSGGGNITFSKFYIGCNTGTPNASVANATLMRCSTNDYSTGTHTPVGNVTISGTSNSTSFTTDNLTETISSGSSSYYFLVADVIGTGSIQPYVNSMTIAVDNVGNNYNSGGYNTYTYYNINAGTATPIRVTPETGGLTSAATPLVAGTTDVAALGFSLTSTGAYSMSQIYINSNIGTLSQYFSSFTLYTTGATATYSMGGRTAVTATVTMTGSYVKVAISGTNLQATTTKQYYWLVGNISASITGSIPASPQFNISNGQSNTAFTSSSPSGTYNTPTVFGPTYNVNYTSLTVGNLTGGVASGTLTAGATGICLFGFSVTSSAAASFSQFNVNTSGTPGSYFNNAKLYRQTSANTTYPTSPVQVGTVSFSGAYANVVFSTAEPFTAGQTFNYFLVADNYGTAASTTIAFKFVSGQSTNAFVQTSPTSNYNTFNVTGNTLTLPAPTFIVTGLNAVANGITTSVNPGDTQKAFFGFSVQAVGALTLDAVNIDFPAGSNNTYFSNAKLYYSSSDNVYGPAADDNSIASGSLNGGNVAFSGLAIGLTNTTRNYFLVCDVQSFNNGSSPATVYFRFASGQGQSALIQQSPYTTFNTYNINGATLTMPPNTTFIWTGATNTDPANNGNWSNYMVPSATSNFIIPGGKSTYPSFGTTATYGTLSFTGTGGNVTIQSGVTITHGAISAAANASGTINGPGTITSATDMTINSGATLATTAVMNLTGAAGLANSGTLNLSTANFSVAGATTNSGNINLTGAGVLTLTGAVTNSATGSVTLTGAGNTSLGSTLANSGTISKTGAGTLSITGAVTNNSGGSISQGAASGALTFSSTTANTGAINQTTAAPVTFTGVLTNNSGGTVTQSGTGTITITAAPTLSAGSSITQSGAGTITFGNTVSNSGTFTQSGAGTINFPNDVTNNSGGSLSLGSGTGTVALTGGATQTITNNNASTPATFNGLSLTTNTNKTLAGTGIFDIVSTGLISFPTGFSSTLATGGVLTLQSGATGTASVGNLYTGTVTGNVTAERYLTGGTGYNATRGNYTYRNYRTMSSPVYNGTSTYNYYTLGYVAASAIVTGATGTGTYTTTGNPTLYLYREDYAGNSASFSTSNFRGVTAFTGTTVTADGGSYYPYSGTGFLFYFRGDKTNNLSQKTASPYVGPESVVFSNTGTINQGQVTVRYWRNSTQSVNYSTTATTAGNYGLNLVGNPYPSTIDWEQYQTATSGTGIYGVNLNNYIYEFNPVTNQYDTYTKGGMATGSASRYIPSGEGFFVQAANTGASLQFNETAKVNAQPGTLLLGIPSNYNAVSHFFKLRLNKDSLNYDDVVISFDTAASEKYVESEDALDAGGNGAYESLSSLSKDSVALSINKVPFPKRAGMVIPLSVSALGSTGFNFLLQDIQNVPDVYHIWLKDNFTKDSTDLRAKPNYAFNIDRSNTATYGSNRFQLVIGEINTYKFLGLTAVQVTGGAQLQWKTVNEDVFLTFTVERSTDNGKTFNPIGSLQSASLGAYSFLDKNPGKGLNIYRIKQDDINSDIFYSPLVSLIFLDNGVSSPIQLYPNPVAATFNVDISAVAGLNSGTYSYRIFNASGTMLRETVTPQPVLQQDASQLPSGTYIIQVYDNYYRKIIGFKKFTKI